MGCKVTYIPLGELAKFESGGTPSKKEERYWNGTIPWISAKTLVGDAVSKSDLCITKQGLDAGSKLAPKGSLLLLTRGSGLFKRIPLAIAEKDVAYNQDIKCIETTAEGISNRYLFYALKALEPAISATLETTGIGAGKLATDRLKALQIPVLDEAARSKVTYLADCINGKLSLNTKLNGYLEEWGQSLLKNYQESCATTIPLHNVMDFGNGYAFKSGAYIQSGLYKILTIKNVQDGSVDCSTSNRIDELPPKMKSFCKLQPGNVVLSLTGNVGRVGIVSEENCLLNQRVAVLQPYNYALLPGLYFHFRQKAFQNEMIGIAKGTAQANLSPVETLKLEMPYNESFLDISQKLKPAFDLILANTIESKRLTVFRDTLLPKLMSGEIDVSKVDLTQLLNSHLA